jgi:hypothetical protein
VRVTPSRGYPSTTFRVSFTAPARTGRVGGTRSTDVVTATGPHGPKGCVDGADTGLGASRAGQRLTATLAPAAHRSRWCPGAYTGRVDMTTRPVCQPGRMCPQFVAVRRIGSFRFVVRAVR